MAIQIEDLYKADIITKIGNLYIVDMVLTKDDKNCSLRFAHKCKSWKLKTGHMISHMIDNILTLLWLSSLLNTYSNEYIVY